MNNYRIHKNYRDDDILRNAFFDFIETVYPGLNFKIWFEKGFWRDEYDPHSIMIDGRIVSNISTTRMNLFVDGKQVDGIQIGTVGTIPEYQRQGLSRTLMEHVLDKYKGKTEIIFLYSSEEAFKFYPKFGFDRYNEVIFIQSKDIPKGRFSARKLDINSVADFELIKKWLSRRSIISKLFGASDYDFITMWHILNRYPANLFYLEEDEIIFIASEKNSQLHILDIIYHRQFDLTGALSRIIESNNLKSVHYYFSPDQLDFKYDEVVIDTDSPLFVRGKFPIGGRHFKFPATAQT
ncbi:MAG TPA: GNAT family N-acetyltransferase [candidate division Zixibacteria bacterium]|nr:GNAT family N-acetyltransferase [candidate division Zixibacteria bacterium]HEQ98244.1 GNAT family N-acetyltransferase [candidate division Zixibacteria bacterium]